MKLVRYFGLVCIVVFCTQPLFAQSQLKNFSDEPEKFIQELENFFETGSANKKDAAEFIKDFKKVWGEGPKKPGIFKENHRQAIYETCNTMLKKRLRPYPDFAIYLKSVTNFVSTGQPEKNFISWQECITKILSGKAIKNYTEFLSMSENLFAANTFFKSPSIEWKASNSNYTFQYDSVPKVVFPGLDLKCYNVQRDSGIIFNTQGIYYPLVTKFVGSGGRVNWARTGLDGNKVYAELKHYQIPVRNGGFSADSVIFHNPDYFDKPLLGILHEKVISEAENVISYPRFESYNKRFKINNISPDVDYDGGFSMRGAKFLGSGGTEEDAFLTFKRENKPFLIAASKNFAITKDKLSSENAAVKIYFDKDSIMHPTLQLRYTEADKRLALIRTEDGNAKTPFFNTYHDIDMYFEEFVWKTNEPIINLQMLVGSTLGEAQFESSDYFRVSRYDRVQGMNPVNPLVQVKDYVKSINGKKEFKGEDLAKFMKITHSQLAPFLVTLSTMGFLQYDATRDHVTVKDRLFSYITARAGKTDYDVLLFHSVIHNQANASINLLNYDMTIRGIESIALSDSQNVYIIPSEKQIILKKNRDFIFAGLINAGRMEFFGKEFSFEYDKFKINMPNVDSLRLKVESEDVDQNGRKKLTRVKTVIEHINGDLLIDNPANKSGTKKFPQYPIFNSFKDSYVYYDKKSIQNGVYKRDNFYFHLEPFTIDSLDNFNNKSINFKGTFVSAGIFPEFKEALTVQSDYSLGFIRKTPPEGFAAYGGKGKYKNEINLSNRGLKGDGALEYVTSITQSNEFIFFPDSMNTHAQNFDVKEQKSEPEFPQIKGEEVYVHWLPKSDSMQIYKKQKPFLCYNGQADFNGRLDLTPAMLYGTGIVGFAGAELESKKIKFKQHKFNADTADFRLKALELSDLAFSTENVNAEVDFDKRMGDFKSNGKGSVVKFPVNQYICFMDNFKWFMDQSTIELSASSNKDNPLAKGETAEAQDLDLTGPEFISVHPKQDSLRFHAASAKYDLKKYIISAKEVNFINVADARIYPSDGNVVIEKNASMKPLEKAKILANTVTKYHTVYDATTSIYAKKSYEASGYYDYVDESKGKQTIYFSKVSVDTTYQTFAETDIPETAKFSLSPNFEYKGKVKLFASRQFLNFNGVCRIQHACDKLNRTWFKFAEDINPEQIYIPVSQDLEDIGNDKIASSIMVTTDSTHLYTAFLGKKRSKNDLEVLPAWGFLFFDKPSKEYRISTKEKLVERSLPGNYLSLNTTSCIVTGEGKINMGADLGQVKLETVGNASHYTVNDSSGFDILLGVDFFFEDNLLEKMAEAINNSADLKPTELTRATYERGLREMLDKERADKLISQLGLYGSFKKFPDELKKTIFFTDIRLKWGSATRSFVSSGKIGIGNINKIQINKFVDGRVELIKKRGGDILNIYLEIDANNWYFFTYTRGVMQAISSNEVFNNGIKELKADKREKKGEKNEPNYQYNLSTIRKKNDFLKKTDASQSTEE